MKFTFLSLFLLLVFAPFVAAQEASAIWQVTKYDITANLSSAPDRVLSATAVVNLKNVGRGAGSSVTFRLNPRGEIGAVKVGANAATVKKSPEEKLAGLQRFAVTLLNQVQPNGETAVTIEYRLTVAENTGLNAISPVGSQFLPLSVWYPTPTNPYSLRGADFAPFTLNVKTTNGETVISSGKANAAGFEQNLFAQPFFVVGTWETGEASPKNGLTAYVPKGASEAEKKRATELLNLAAAAREFAAAQIGTSKSIQNISLIAVQRGAGFADGGAILLDYAAFRRPKLDAQTVLTITEGIVKAHLNNSTPIRGDGYGAISEGLPRFIATQFIEKQFGREVAEIERLRQRTSYAAIAKIDAPISQTAPADSTFLASAANKGAMIWRLVAREIGEEKFFEILRTASKASQGSNLTLANLRQAFALSGGDKVTVILDYGFDLPTDTDLLVGLPQVKGAETVAALKNQGSLPVAVNITAITEKGDKLTTTANIAEKNFGQAVFKTNAKIVRIEIDPEKFYPQIDFSNDFAPREFTDNDLNAETIRAFNRSEFAKAETAARKVLAIQPRFDEARMWLGRAMLAQDKTAEAEREFNSALNEKLPTAKTQAWANIGLGEIALKRKQTTEAAKFFSEAVRADAEYGSNLAARNRRIENEPAANIEEAIKTFFAAFDKAVITARKTEVQKLVLDGELNRFSTGVVAGQPEQWQTKVLRTETVDANHLAVEVSLIAKLLGKDAQSGTAVFTLARTANGLKIVGVDLFEVR